MNKHDRDKLRDLYFQGLAPESKKHYGLRGVPVQHYTCMTRFLALLDHCDGLEKKLDEVDPERKQGPCHPF